MSLPFIDELRAKLAELAQLDLANDAGYAPDLGPTGTRHTFQSWYLAWLEQSLAKLRGSGA